MAVADSWTKKTWGGPSAGWPSFCSSCGQRADRCDAEVEREDTRTRSDAVCMGGLTRRADRLQKGRSMELDPKPRPV